MADDLKGLDVAALAKVTAPYRNALYHRSTVVEGIRKVANRNLAHLGRATRECGYTGGLPEDGIEVVQARMLEEQELDNSNAHRSIIPWATFLPVQIYLCLLYASIEFYERTSRKNALYKDLAMDECIARHAKVIGALQDFRDSFLHPREKSMADEMALLMAIPSDNSLSEIQMEFDNYLERSRQRAVARLQEAMERLPEIQRMYCFYRAYPIIARRMAVYHDDNGLEVLKRQFEMFNGRMEQIVGDGPLWQPSKRQSRAALDIVHCLSDVSPSRAEREYEPLSEQEIQTPLPIPSPVFGMMAAGLIGGGSPLNMSNRSEAHIKKANWPLNKLMLAAYVLFNEVLHNRHEIIQPGIKNLDMAIVSTEEQIAKGGLQIVNETIAPGRVIMALIHEPLRVYRKAAAQNPRLRSELLEQYLAVPDRVRAHRSFRNSVFHVVDDPVRADRQLQAAAPDPGIFMNPNVFSELTGVFAHPQAA